MGSPNKTLIKPLTVKVFVRSPGGAPINDALVRLKRNSSASDDSTERTKDGVAVLVLRETDFPSGSTTVSVTIQASKRHHGPMSADGINFKNGPVVVSVTANSMGGFADGTPSVDDKGRLNLVLVDGGMLGQFHSNTLARRLSTQEVVEELLYGHSRGLLTLNKGSEFECTHDPSGDPDGENGDPCTADCRIVAPTQNDNNRLSLQPTIGGVTIAYITGWWNTNGKTPAILWTGRKLLQKMYRRNVVALARLCYMLSGWGYKVLYTAGVEGSDPASRNDSHGQGRAMDFHGAAKEMPIKGQYREVRNPTTGKIVGSGNESDVRLGIDFIIWYHWGMMKLQEANSATRVAETHKDYEAEGKPSPNGRLLYRLEPLPDATARPPKMDLTDAHLAEAATLFKNVHDFVTRQYSNRETSLGPISLLPKPRVAAATADDAVASPDIGAVAAQVLHPDYPTANTNPWNGREAHVNHFHVQFGITNTMPWKDLP